MKKIVILIIYCFAIAIFSPQAILAKSSTAINQKENQNITSSVGDTLVKVTLKESLPNAFGGADIFGRKRERGFVEIRYMGLSGDGKAIFRRRSVDIFSNETTMSRSGPMAFGSGYVSNGTGNFSSFAIGGQKANVEVLPPDTIEFALDANKNKIITVEDRIIEIVSADNGIITFRISKSNR